MFDEINTVLASTDTGLHLVLLIGVAIFCGTIGARVFQALKIPQIIGFIVIGVGLGPVLGVVPHETVLALEPFNLFALGLIGFLIGGELKR